MEDNKIASNSVKWIYHIQTSFGHYIGKISTDKYLDYHSRIAAPVFMQQNRYREKLESWESAWRSLIERKGFYFTIKNKFIQKSCHNEYNNVKSILLETINTSLKNNSSTQKQGWSNPKEVWNSFYTIWKPKTDPDLSITEALCILLSSRNKKLLNKKIDFMGHSLFNENSAALLDKTREYNRKILARMSDFTPVIYVKIEGQSTSKKYALIEYCKKNPEVQESITEEMEKHIVRNIKEQQQKISDKFLKGVYDELLKCIHKGQKIINIEEVYNKLFVGKESKLYAALDKSITASINVNTYFEFLLNWYNKTDFHFNWIDVEDDLKTDYQYKWYREKFSTIMQDRLSNVNLKMANQWIGVDEIDKINTSVKLNKHNSNIKQWLTQEQLNNNFITQNKYNILKEQLAIKYGQKTIDEMKYY